MINRTATAFLLCVSVIASNYFDKVHAFVPLRHQSLSRRIGNSFLTKYGRTSSFLAKNPTRISTSLHSSPSSVVDSEETETTASKDDDAVGAWLPVGTVSGLDGLGPVKMEIAGRDYVVWNDEPGNVKRKKKDISSNKVWSVMEDVCPHKLAPLSQGRVSENGCLECPYHGWQFESDGKLTCIPQLDEGSSVEALASKAHAKSLPVHVVGDAIFAFFPSSVHGEVWPQSKLPEDLCPALLESVNSTWFMRELPYSVDFLLENFMDPAHIPFAHHGLQGTRDDGSSIAIESVAFNFTHVEASFVDTMRGKERTGVLSFQRPFYYHFRTKRDDGDFRKNLSILITPVRPGKSRIMLRTQMEGKLPFWLSHGASNRFLNTDTWLHDLEYHARRNTKGLRYVDASSSDLSPTLFRKWWAKFGFASSRTYGPASGDDLTRISRREQIDPWENHTKYCQKCRTALRRFKKAQVGTVIGALGSILFLRKRPAISFTMSILNIWLNIFIRKICTFIEGNPYSSEIGDRSVSAAKD